MKKHRNKKLILQISIITLLIFAATLAYSILTDYSITKDSYLSSKNEMIDRDLKNTSDTVKVSLYSNWFWDYVKEHGEDIIRPLTNDEIALRESEEISLTLFDFSMRERTDIEECSPEVQLFEAKNLFDILTFIQNIQAKSLNYASMEFLEFTNENEAYLYLKNTPDEPEALSEESRIDDYTRRLYTDCFKPISYKASEHSAVEKILAGELNKEGETLYEVYSDPTDGKDYYIGYTPIIINGEIGCYFCIRYDWSEFRKELLAHALKSMVIGFVVLLVLNGLLMMFIYMNIIKPLSKVKNSVEEYMNDKDSGAVVKKMNELPARNEIGVLADRFADMAEEIDRYTKDNLRLATEKERVTTELSLATSIQTGSLPNIFPAFPERKEFDIYASMNPAKEVGGDFYDFFMIDGDHLAMVIADVSGKGVPAALFMMATKILINDHALMGGTPAEILTRVNKQVCSNNEANMFVTVCFGILEISTGKLTASNAGHEYPFVNLNGKYELLKDKHGVPIGAIDMAKYRDIEITLKKGDSIFLYTDGVAEATNASEELFGTDRTIEALNILPDASPKDILKNVHDCVDGFVGEAPQFDDLTMVGLKYFGA